MPRRKAPFIPAGQVVVNGQRYDADGVSIAKGRTADSVDFAKLKSGIVKVVDTFDELALIEERDKFVADLTYSAAAPSDVGMRFLIPFGLTTRQSVPKNTTNNPNENAEDKHKHIISLTRLVLN
jgi:hypothetical protein